MNPQAVVTLVVGMLGAFLGNSPVYQFLAPVIIQLVTAYDNLVAGHAADLTSAIKVKGVAYNLDIRFNPAAPPPAV